MHSYTDPSKLDVVDRLACIDYHLGLLLRDTCKAKWEGAGLPLLFRSSAPVLIYLLRHGKSYLGAIAEGTGQSAAALTWTAKEFVSGGLATRETDAKDARVSWLELTELGEKYAGLAEKGRAESVGKLLSGMTKEQTASFEQCLELAFNTLKKHP